LLTVALGFDGVLFPLPAALAVWASPRGVDLPGEPDGPSWWRSCGLSDDDWVQLVADFGEDSGYQSADPYPEALDGLVEIFDLGHDLVGATSRRPTRRVEASTFGWVAQWVLPMRAVLIGPASKLEVECDLIVDDDPAALDAVDEMGEACGLLLDRPWNRDAVGFPRVSWSALPALVEMLGEQVAAEADADRRFVLAEAVESLRPVSA